MFMPQFNGYASIGERAPLASLADEIWSAMPIAVVRKTCSYRLSSPPDCSFWKGRFRPRAWPTESFMPRAAAPARLSFPEFLQADRVALLRNSNAQVECAISAKVSLVTGADSGIGTATAMALTRQLSYISVIELDRKHAQQAAWERQ